jgi:hypothetical protein
MLVSSLSGKQEHLNVDGIKKLTQGEKWLNGAKRGALFVGAGALCILLPVVHFFLVPLCLLLAPVMGFLETRKTHRHPQVDFKCVDCQQSLSLSKGCDTFPLTMNCQNCGARLHLETELPIRV